MKQPLWKVLLSYLTEVEIEQARSVYNDHLTVLLVKGQYQLTTDEAIYSYGLRYDNYYSAFSQLDLQRLGPSALLLGLGLGSIPYMLEHAFKKKYSYTAVEIDEEIIYLASKYVLHDLDSDIQTINADALTFVNMDPARYHFVAMDIFVSDYIPAQFESFEYLQELKHKIAHDGLLLFNRLYYYDHDKKKTEQYYSEVFCKVFSNATRLDINGNWILVSDKSYLL